LKHIFNETRGGERSDPKIAFILFIAFIPVIVIDFENREIPPSFGG
jgi:hypothetical protein